jgi:hypothetical protein
MKCTVFFNISFVALRSFSTEMTIHTKYKLVYSSQNQIQSIQIVSVRNQRQKK